MDAFDPFRQFTQVLNGPTHIIRRFFFILQVGIGVHQMPTVSAHQALIEGGMRRDDRKGTVDKVAAAVILQTYLDAQKS